MEDKHGFGDSLNEFIAGKGFYIVLLLCAGLIAGSIWLLTSGSGAVQKQSETEVTETVPAGAVPAMKVEQAVLPTATPLPPNVPPQAPAVAPAMAEETEEQAAAETGAAEEIVYGLRHYFLWPVNGPVDRGCSLETLSYDPTMGDWRVHTGLDISAPEGTDVLATTDGTVAAVYADNALGSVVEIDHDEGLRSIYANLADTVKLRPGDRVTVGDVIGTVGHSAVAETGAPAHLHFAMTVNGQTVDPIDILPKQ